jgi:hypothetical protein
MVTCELWRDRPVLVTRHPGFKGGWLALYALCLEQIGRDEEQWRTPPGA